MIAPDSIAALDPVAHEIATHGSACIIIFGPGCWAITSAGGGATAAPAPRPAADSGSPSAAGIYSEEAS